MIMFFMSIIIAVYLLNFAAYIIFAEQKCVLTQKYSVIYEDKA